MARNQVEIGMKTYLEFTGKETDCETGYSYFGARYYDPTLLTSFLSIDRYADKYPSLSPYHYCAWNPIMLVDPNGDSVYSIDKWGYISIDRDLSTREEYLGKDVLTSTKTGSKIEFEEGTLSVSSNIDQYYEFIENGELISGIETGTYIEIKSNAEVAESIYDFCVSNTDHIEFSCLQTNKRATNWIVSTSHKHDIDPFSTAMGYAFAAGGMFYSHRHHHPYNGVNCKRASDGDKTFMRRVKAMMNHMKNYTPIFGISLKVEQTIKYLQYNESDDIFE